MIDQNMNRMEIHRRQLEINIELGRLSEEEIEARQNMLEIERQAAAFNLELAELALLESQFGPPIQQRARHAR